MTSCSIFIHNNPTIDNCDQLSKRSYQTNPIAYIQRKKRFILEYFEYSIRIRELEILATRGFFGGVIDMMPVKIWFLFLVCLFRPYLPLYLKI